MSSITIDKNDVIFPFIFENRQKTSVSCSRNLSITKANYLANRLSINLIKFAKDRIWGSWSCHIHIPDCLTSCLSAGVCGVLHTGHVPTEDSHHSIVFCLHAGEKVGFLPVALAGLPHGWSHSCAGTTPTVCPGLAAAFNVVCFCRLSTCLYLNLHSGLQRMMLILSRRPYSLQAPSLWGWWLCWWRVFPVALREFTLRKFSRRLNRACGSVTYNWVSKASVYYVEWEGLSCVNIRVCPFWS